MTTMLWRLLLAGCLSGLALPLALPPAAQGQPASNPTAIDKSLAAGERFLSTGAYLAAKTEFQRAQRAAQAQQDRASERRALTGLARVEYRQGRYPLALSLLQRADLLVTTPFERGAILSTRGAIWLESGDYRDARQALQLGLTYLQQGRPYDSARLAAIQRTRIDLGRTLGFLGWYDRALQTLQIALQGSINGSNRQIALQAIADVKFELGQYTEALDTYQQALNASGTGFDRLRQAQILVRLGQAQQVLGNLEAAEASYQQALGQIRGLGAWSQQVFALNFLGQLATERGESERALEFFREAQATFSSSGGVGRVATLLNLGHYYRQQGDRIRAREFFLDALSWAQNNGDRIGIVRARSGLGQVYLEGGNLVEAIAELEASTTEFEGLRPGLRDAQKVSLFETQRQTYRLLQRAYVEQDRPGAALVASERSRARAFVELLARRLSDKPLTTEGVAPPTLEEIRAVARQQDAMLVSYSILYDDANRETELLIWVVAPDGEITLRRRAITAGQPDAAGAIATSRRAVESGRDLQAVVADIRQIARSGQPPAPNPGGVASLPTQQAYDLLIEPIADLLPTDPDATAVFVPDGPLFLLPLPILQDATGTYLIERHTLAIAPSIQALALTQSLPQVSFEGATIVGNPAPMPMDLLPLPGSETEAETIGQLLQVTPAIGSQATETRLREALPQAGLIHLATHAFFDPRQGLQSAIALAPTEEDDGLLTAAEILDLELQAGLAVLSACDTGRGQITGDGVVGLSRSLISAGVPSAVVTLWAIPDLATADLMAEFYRQLQQKRSTPQALRQAMLATREKYPAPRDWASFVLIGRPQ